MKFVDVFLLDPFTRIYQIEKYKVGIPVINLTHFSVFAGSCTAAGITVTKNDICFFCCFFFGGGGVKNEEGFSLASSNINKILIIINRYYLQPDKIRKIAFRQNY